MFLLMGTCIAEKEPAFRDLYWGDPISQLGDATKVYDRADGFNMWQKKTENLQFDNIVAKKITYNFLNDRLFEITITNEDYNALSEFAHVKYGKPYSSKDSDLINEEFYEKGNTICRIISIKGVGPNGEMNIYDFLIANDYYKTLLENLPKNIDKESLKKSKYWFIK